MPNIWASITREPISPEQIINRVRVRSSGCVLSYIGLIRDVSFGKKVVSVEYADSHGNAAASLNEIIAEVPRRWPVDCIAICHRLGKLSVGDINVVIAVSSPHRQEAFAACQYAIDLFKEKLPTRKTETYTDGTVKVEERPARANA